MEQKFIKDLKVGEYFTLKPTEEPSESLVRVRGEYDRSTKTYDCYKFSDVNAYSSYKGNKVVYVGFTF